MSTSQKPTRGEFIKMLEEGAQIERRKQNIISEVDEIKTQRNKDIPAINKVFASLRNDVKELRQKVEYIEKRYNDQKKKYRGTIIKLLAMMSMIIPEKQEHVVRGFSRLIDDLDDDDSDLSITHMPEDHGYDQVDDDNYIEVQCDIEEAEEYPEGYAESRAGSAAHRPRTDINFAAMTHMHYYRNLVTATERMRKMEIEYDEKAGNDALTYEI